MTLTTSPVKNKSSMLSVFLWVLKNNFIVTLIFTILMFTEYPLIMFWTASSQIAFDYKVDVESLEYMASYLYPFTSLTAVIFALVVSFICFKHLHNKRSVDFYGALPLSRHSMFFAHYFAGLTILAVPILLNGIIAIIANAVLGVNVFEFFIPHLLIMLLTAFASFNFNVFLSTCSGKGSSAIVLSLGLQGMFPFAVLITSAMFTSWVPGFNNIFADIPLLIYMLTTPASISIVSAVGYFPFENWDGLAVFILYFIVFAVFFLFTGYFTYKKRRMECAQTEFAFKLPANIIRFIITYTVGIMLSAMFASILEASEADMTFRHIWFWIGMLIGTFIAHIILEAILSKGFKQFKRSLITYGSVLGFAVVLYAFTMTGFFGIYAYIPNAEDVVSVSLGNDHSLYCDYYGDNNNSIFDLFESPVVKDKEFITDVIDVHKDIIKNIKDNELLPFGPGRNSYGYDYYSDYSSYIYNFEITYTLKNGKEITRTYTDSSLQGIFGKIYALIESQAYVQANFEMVRNTIEKLPDNEEIRFAVSGDIPNYYHSESLTKEKAIEIIDGIIFELGSAEMLSAFNESGLLGKYDSDTYSIYFESDNMDIYFDYPTSSRFLDTYLKANDRDYKSSSDEKVPATISVG